MIDCTAASIQRACLMQMQYIYQQYCASITKYCDKTVVLWHNRTIRYCDRARTLAHRVCKTSSVLVRSIASVC